MSSAFLLRAICLLLLVWPGPGAWAQKPDCLNRLDSAQVRELALQHHAWWTGPSCLPPRMEYNPETCLWTVVSSSFSHTRRGKCRFTNGCTLVRSITLILDARSKKRISKKKSRKLYENYE